MSAIWGPRLCCLAILIMSASASPVREFPFLNSTGVAIRGSLAALVTAPSTASRPITTEDWLFRPHLESTADGFEVATTPNARGSQTSAVVGPGTIWSGIIHIESTVTGFGTPTSTQQDDAATELPHSRNSDMYRPHLESTASGFLEPPLSDHRGPNLVSNSAPLITPPPVAPPTVILKGNTLRPVVVTSVVIDTVTLTPGGETAIIGDGPSATRIYLDASGHPVVAISSSTSTIQIPATISDQVLIPGGPPITVGPGSAPSTISINSAGETIAAVEGRTSTLQAAPTQTFTISDVPATAIATAYRYAIGSSLLTPGHPITLDGTTIAVTTDPAGAIVLIAPDATTTLPDPAPAPTTSSLDNILAHLSTTVVSGSTLYVFASQTLHPGHPVTLDGTVVSLATSSGATMLVVGTQTTTIDTAATTTVSAEFGALTPGVVGEGPAATAVAEGGAAFGRGRWGWVGLVVGGVSVAAVGLG
ncbi:hypothetical protein K505DRAFT_378446 [Melanomma pulvis-pyrius CBS 109.77]|uniref:Uncharacterized protein n=1 Tax=Melanomma pulvis-pyrius CBS 109.77 TaxID=1314802 RepID=A0A6A6WYU0_9PLEO|nr:hypothetical protein K505DRAFT_378446 [Melanomma pulvis-pyrius CBS 109.77]